MIYLVLIYTQYTSHTDYNCHIWYFPYFHYISMYVVCRKHWLAVQTYVIYRRSNYQSLV